ncbi:MAG: phosphatase PAP2 family protein [Ghiorsea sp.]
MKLPVTIFILFLIPAFLWNHEIFLFINGSNSYFFDFVLGNLSGLGDKLVAAILILMLMLFKLRLGLAALLAFVISGIITEILKYSLDFPRPPAVFEHVHLLGHSLNSYSLPSGHSSICGVMALLALLIWKENKKIAWSVFTLFIFAAYGRIYGGAHFPIDVVTGLAIGYFSIYFSNTLSLSWNTDIWLKSEWSWKLPSLALMITSVILAMGYQILPETAQGLALIVPVFALLTVMQTWKKRLD